ncbi:MAG TPA: undecaprenyldiphospho-muramoylpentapeptide beta-N-acetylglucosaminyltransferase [Proteobacteria bacterium]|nr:undecaprenyldiphospho-muramoylpentapeptide beta-N-acetylglucosaminyltransferase [Pseudomonadota bacterium]
MSVARPVKTILFAGGGTGGHLFPGIALAEEFLAREPNTRIIFAGTRRGIEARILPELGYPLVFLDVQGFVGVGRRRSLQAALSFPKAVIQALILLVRYRPALIVGLGGYASAPVLLAAMVGGLPWVIQEQNVFPGLVNRLLAPFAAAVFTAYDRARDHLRSRRIHNYGNPLRSGLRGAGGGAESGPPAMDNQEQKETFALLVVGGSQGASIFNRLLPAVFARLAARYPRLWIVHQSGQAQLAAVAQAYAAWPDRARAVAFIEDMEKQYAAADLVICRAGALTLAELVELGKPSLLVPFPQAAHDHQSFNAGVLVEAGAAWVRPEVELDEENLAADIESLIKSPQRLMAMSRAALQLRQPGAAARIVDHCRNLM